MTLQPPLFPGVPHLRMVGKRLVEVGTAACSCCGRDFLPGPGRPRRTKKDDGRKPAPLCRRCIEFGESAPRLRTIATLVLGEIIDGRFKKRWSPERRGQVAAWLAAFATGDADRLEWMAPAMVKVLGPEVRRRAASRSRYRNARERAQAAALACLLNYANVARRRHANPEVVRQQGADGPENLGTAGAG